MAGNTSPVHFSVPLTTPFGHLVGTTIYSLIYHNNTFLIGLRLYETGYIILKSGVIKITQLIIRSFIGTAYLGSWRFFFMEIKDKPRNEN